ncbi:MAG: hypothetical protein Q9219_005050 [cf. Caloplaca sp. 3 TL-2023]
MVQKVCFVTIGATATFDPLLKAVLTSEFLQALEALKYTSLRLQYGNNGQKILNELKYQRGTDDSGIEISGFDFNSKGLGQEMWCTKAAHERVEGVVAILTEVAVGSGSILDALRIQVPLVVVPNTSLLHNHQVELAEELSKQGYLVHGHLDDLPAALSKAELQRKKLRSWPPIDHAIDPSGKGLAGVMDEEMGFYD